MSLFPQRHSSDPLRANEPIFQSPWEARAFAMVNQLAIAQEYSWTEWTEQFAEEISADEEAEATDISSYYERWVRACEKLLIAKGILDDQSIEQRIKELLLERETNGDHNHSKHTGSTVNSTV